MSADVFGVLVEFLYTGCGGWLAAAGVNFDYRDRSPQCSAGGAAEFMVARGFVPLSLTAEQLRQLRDSLLAVMRRKEPRDDQ